LQLAGDTVFVGVEKQFKVDIDSDVVESFNGLTEQLGMKNKVVVERLLKFFLAQPDPVRRYLIGMVDGREPAAITAYAEGLIHRPDKDIAGTIGQGQQQQQASKPATPSQKFPRRAASPMPRTNKAEKNDLKH
jgi:hypothetical protein